VEYRWPSRDKLRDWPAFASWPQSWRVLGRRSDGCHVDKLGVTVERRVSRSTQPASGNPGQQRKRCTALDCRDIYGATDDVVKPKQSERSLIRTGDFSPYSRRAIPSGSSGGSSRTSPDSDEILSGLTTAVAVLQADLRVVYLNPAAESLLGVSLRRSLGRPLAALVSPADELVDLCTRALKDGVTYGCREFSARAGDREVIVDCRATPMEDIEGRLLLELFDTQRDQQMRREAELVAQRRLSRRIVRQLAHEVKNPLGGLRGAAQLLERQLPDAELRAYTDVIIDEADRLAALVDSILSAGGKPKQETFNLHMVSEHVAKLLESDMPEGVALTRDYDPSLPSIISDRDQLIQAYLNLALNALQSLGGTGRIVLRTRALTNFLLGGRRHSLVLSLEVEDNGPGIPDELIDTIFYPLVTGRKTGSGLGLTIAQDLVSQNAGLIEFSSKLGETVFKIRLPITNERAQS
jgi:two-component system nitrogen regulation sensor histidine kinase GlnL